MLQQIVTVLGTLVTRSHPCQQDLGDEEDEQEVEEGSSELDWLVIDTALDVVLGLAAALGTDFMELWKIFDRPVMKFASSSVSNERSTAVGVLAEVVKYVGAAVTPYTETFLRVLIKRLTDEDSLTKSNAAYAIGQLVLNSTDTSKTLPSFRTIFDKLEPLVQIKESRMIDNVAGCLARMMTKHPDNGFVEEVLPLVAGVLPLKEDYEENAPIYTCIFKLCKDCPCHFL
jgi:importin-4